MALVEDYCSGRCSLHQDNLIHFWFFRGLLIRLALACFADERVRDCCEEIEGRDCLWARDVVFEENNEGIGFDCCRELGGRTVEEIILMLRLSSIWGEG